MKRLIAKHPDAFWTRVNVGAPDDCWTWKMGHTAAGYAQTTADGRHAYAHRVAYELAVGPIPEGLTIDHLCRNPGCVNPRHLEPVTMAENIRRAAAAKTHCPHGHEYTAGNTYVNPTKGFRVCRTCTRDRNRAHTRATRDKERYEAKVALARTCAGCGAPLDPARKVTAKWCTQTCRAKTNWQEELARRAA